MANKPTCLITGVGPGTGSALVRRFSEDYNVAMIARDAQRLDALADVVDNARAYPCDVTDTAKLRSVIETISSDTGTPEIVIHNAVGGLFGEVLDIDPAALEFNFQVNTMALLHLIQAIGPAMVEAGKGVILTTGNTSAYRGKASFAGFAPSKAAQRILIESTARSLGPKGIHAAYVAIDAVIDVPWTRQMFADRPDEYFCKPEDIASECFHIAHQPRSAWSSEIVIRPFGEQW